MTAIERSRRQLEIQNERLDQVASTISHDLRNPIQVADGYVEILADPATGYLTDDPIVREEAQEHVDAVTTSLTRMEEIIQDVLTLAREGQTVEETESVELADITREAWGMVDTKAATLELEESRTLEADPGRLRSMLENLYRNAVEHGRDDVTVTVGRTERGFFVQDDGPGIAADEQEAVFEYGYTTNPDGTGFGLSIVQTMVESHGWTVALDSEYTDGARFIVDTTGRAVGGEAGTGWIDTAAE
ncbi:MAG: HAMP domain-containing sensor histidine kinase [Natrialbaceae archaeon]|nr:HAMP domain-containing sensor histidine kinase [Natrialbaceae archaeon]